LIKALTWGTLRIGAIFLPTVAVCVLEMCSGVQDQYRDAILRSGAVPNHSRRPEGDPNTGPNWSCGVRVGDRVSQHCCGQPAFQPARRLSASLHVFPIPLCQVPLCQDDATEKVWVGVAT